MSNSIARFRISADEDFRIQFVFVGLSLAGRDLRVLVKERASNAIRATLTFGAGLTLDGTDTVTALVPQATAAAWAKGEFETDLHDITGGANTRLVGARTLYDLPGRLPYGVIGAKATVQWVVNKAIVTAIGGIGPSGPANVLTPGAITMLPPGSPPAVRITGAAPNQTIEFDIPGAAPGEDGTDGIDGSDGEKGWSAVEGGLADGARIVKVLVDWVGGTGAKPPVLSGGLAQYVGATGYVTDIASATDFRGAAGTASIPNGNKGSITTFDDGDTWIINEGAVGEDELADGGTSNAKLADMANGTVKGRVSPGDGPPEDLSQAQQRTALGITAPGVDLITAANKADQRAALQITAAGEALLLAASAAVQTALLNAMVGDSGSGGTKGMVPAPAAGDAPKALFGDGTYKNVLTAMPNDTIVGTAYTSYTTYNSFSAVIPIDDTPPTSSEGVQLLSLTYTPKSATNKLRVRFSLWGSMSADGVAVAALFTGGSSAAQVSAVAMATGKLSLISGEFEYTPGSTSPATISLRVGPQSGFLYVNGGTAARVFGGAARAVMTLEEIKA